MLAHQRKYYEDLLEASQKDSEKRIAAARRECEMKIAEIREDLEAKIRKNDQVCTSKIILLEGQLRELKMEFQELKDPPPNTY